MFLFDCLTIYNLTIHLSKVDAFLSLFRGIKRPVLCLEMVGSMRRIVPFNASTLVILYDDFAVPMHRYFRGGRKESHHLFLFFLINCFIVSTEDAVV